MSHTLYRSNIRCELSDCGCKRSTMIWISHKHKAIYFETPKAGSSSIKKSLNIGEYRSGSRISNLKRRVIEKDRRFIMWKGDEKGICKSYHSYFKFAFVRNPWDRVVSNWSMFCRSGIRFREQQIEELFGKPAKNIGFEEFVYWCQEIRNHHWEPFISFLPRNKNGSLEIDYIGKLEKFAHDWSHITNLLGVDMHINTVNKTNHSHYRKYYNEVTRMNIETEYLEDISAFDYSY